MKPPPTPQATLPIYTPTKGNTGESGAKRYHFSKPVTVRLGQSKRFGIGDCSPRLVQSPAIGSKKSHVD